MGTELTLEELAELLREAERAHQDYEQSTGQRDDDWASWYAEYLLNRFGDRR